MARAVSSKLTFTFDVELNDDNLRFDDKSVIGRTFRHAELRHVVAITYADGNVLELDPSESLIGINAVEVEAIQRRFAECIVPLINCEAA